MSQTANNTTYRFIDRFVANAGTFKQNEEFTFTIKVQRSSASDLKLQFLINNTAVAFSDTATSTGGYAASFDSNNVFTSSGYVSSNGMGQRFSVIPSDASSNVVISDLNINSAEANL